MGKFSSRRGGGGLDVDVDVGGPRVLVDLVEETSGKGSMGWRSASPESLYCGGSGGILAPGGGSSPGGYCWTRELHEIRLVLAESSIMIGC